MGMMEILRVVPGARPTETFFPERTDIRELFPAFGLPQKGIRNWELCIGRFPSFKQWFNPVIAI